MTKTWIISLRTDLVRVGRNDFGEEIVGEVGYLVAEDKIGDRWCHDHTFALTRNGESEEGFAFARRDDETRESAEAFEKKVQAAADSGTWAGPIDNPHWVKIEPAYGSEAYAANWREYDYERMDEVGRAASEWRLF